MGTSISNIITVRTPSSGVAPGQATGLIISNVTPSSLTLSWTAPITGNQPFSYQPQIEIQGGSFSNQGSATSNTTVNVTGLTPTAIYLFQIITTNGTGSSTSAASNPVVMPTAAPGQATGLVTSNVTATSLTLSWQAPTTGNPPFSYQPQDQIQGVSGFANAGGTTTNPAVNITGLQPLTTYLFQIITTNSFGSSTSTPSSSVTTLATLSSAPSWLPPTNVTSTSITLSWIAPATGTPPLTYLLYQSLHNANTFVQIASISATTFTITTGLNPATTYDFEVAAQNSAGTGPVSTIQAVFTAPSAPGAPGTPAVVGTPGTTTVSLSWSAPVTGSPPYTYQVLDRTPTGGGTFASVGPTFSGTAGLLTALTQASSYDFEITATNSAGTGPASPPLLDVVTAAVIVIPSAPQSLAAGTITQNSIALSWSAPVSGTPPFTYLVYQSPHGANTFVQITSTGSLSFVVTGLQPSTIYDFEVTAQNSAGTSPPTTVLSPQTSTPPVIVPTAPTGVTSTNMTQTTVTLSWTAPTTGTQPLTYGTRWSPTGQNSWTNGPTGGSSTSAQITGLAAGTVYDFEANATNSAGTSAYSVVYTASTAAAASPTVAWQPIGATSTLAFTNSNLTATSGGSATPGAAVQTCISTSTVSSGNVAWEVTLGAVTQNLRVGLANSSFVFTNPLGLGQNGIGFCASTGTGSPAAQSVVYNAVTVLTPTGGTPAADTPGDVLSFCATIPTSGTGLLWVTSPKMRTTFGANAWNDSATASPATGTGGITLSLTGPLSIAFNDSEGGGAATLNAGSSTFAFTGMPSNFIAWNGAAATVIAPLAPSTPVVGTITATTVALTWSAPATGTPPLTYFILRSPHGANTFVQIGSATITSFTDSSVAQSKAYDFVVYASNAAGNGPNSGIASATTLSSITVPGAPSGLSVTASAATSISLGWQAPSTGSLATGYQVEYKLSTAGSYTKFVTTVPALAIVTSAGGGKITDNDSNVWTIVGGVVQINGTATASSGVVEIAYDGTSIWQENGSNLWWSDAITSAWSGGTNTGPVSPTSTITATASGKLTDNNSNVWQVNVSDQVVLNGVADGTTSGVIEVAFDGTLIWHENGSGQWYSTPIETNWVGGTTTGPVSPTQTVMAGSGGSITDTRSNVWTIVGGVVQVNGVADTTTSNVTAIAIAAGVMWQENTGLLWWQKTPWTATWTGGATTPPATIVRSVSLGASNGTITDAAANVWKINAALQVSLNGVADITTSAVIAIAIAAGVIWYENSEANWWSKGNQPVTWLPAAGSTTGPPTGATQTITGLASGMLYNFLVYAFNAAGNGALSSPAVNGSTTALASSFSISAGKVIAPTGSVWTGRGVAVGDGGSMAQWVSNAACTPLLSSTFFPRTTLVRLACYSFAVPSTYSQFITWLTGFNPPIVVLVENHQAFNVGSSGAWSPQGGGGVGTVPTGTQLGLETTWYSNLASAYKANPYVWFGTTNEPSTVNSSTGNQFDGAALSTWQQAIYAAIRAQSNAIVEIEQPSPFMQGNVGYMTPSVFAAMKNVVYGPHFYAWISGSSATQSFTATAAQMLNNAAGGAAGSINQWGGIVQQVQVIQALTSQDGVVPCCCMEYGNSTTGGAIDQGGQNVVTAVNQAVTNGNISACNAWATFVTGGDQLTNGTSSLTSPYGTSVAALI